MFSFLRNLFGGQPTTTDATPATPFNDAVHTDDIIDRVQGDIGANEESAMLSSERPQSAPLEANDSDANDDDQRTQ